MGSRDAAPTLIEYKKLIPPKTCFIEQVMKPRKNNIISIASQTVFPTDSAYYDLYTFGWFFNFKNRFKNIIKSPD
ncbi:hypothetical protein CKK33_18680 [Mucilaginibacter sp. MD40]|nr:hypothetical protein CKK33_18680 [Mucilaginibacter sp. MD40]